MTASRAAMLLAMGILLSACTVAKVTGTEPEAAELAVPDIATIIAIHEQSIMGLDDVEGIGESLCEGTPCIKIFLSEDNPSTRAVLPAELEGVPVVVELSGGFSAQ